MLLHQNVYVNSYFDHLSLFLSGRWQMSYLNILLNKNQIDAHLLA